jgi:hypothetical protein
MEQALKHSDDLPEQQPVRVEILHSTERPGLTPVFGTAVPPSGLSGVMRRRAFRHSENDLRHWLMLLAADRVNVVEGLLEDAQASPRAQRIAAGAVVGGLVGYLLFKRSRPRVPARAGVPAPASVRRAKRRVRR